VTRRQDGGEEAPLHVRRLFDDGDILQLVLYPLKKGSPDLRVDHLSAAEHDGDFHLVTALQELLGVLRLHLQVVHVYLRAHPDLTQDRGVLLLAGLAVLAWPAIPYTERKKAVDIGPIEVQTETEKHVFVPPLVGIVAAASGVALIAMGRRNA